MADELKDEILAAESKEGNIASFEKLFLRYKRPIMNLIYRLIGNRETAEEVAQEVFVSIYKNIGTYDVNKKFAPWLYTIARNLAKNSLRDRRYFRDVSLEAPVLGADECIELKDVIADPGATPDKIAESNEFSEQAQAVLDTMPQEYKEVIALCSIQGLTYQEAAQILKCSAATVSMRLERAKELFMKRLGIEPGGKGSDQDE